VACHVDMDAIRNLVGGRGGTTVGFLAQLSKQRVNACRAVLDSSLKEDYSTVGGRESV